ncbi:MAG: peptidylprolyl isomerase, partial [Roseobacter sp.]
PFPSSLGPALFRVNAVLAAQNTSFEDAVEIMKPQLAMDRAIRLIEAQAESFDDLLAGGATLEELTAETDMEIGQIDWSVQSTEDVAAYEAFRQVAASVGPNDFPEIERLDDGGLFAVRLDSVLPPRPAPFEDIRAEIEDQWRAEQISAQLSAQLEEQVSQLATGSSFGDLSLDAIVEEDLLRTDFVPNTPPGFMEDIFAMQIGEAQVIQSDAAALVVRLDGIAPPAQDGDAGTLRTQLTQRSSQQLASDVFEIYSADVTRRAEPQINQQALQAVHVNFH